MLQLSENVVKDRVIEDIPLGEQSSVNKIDYYNNLFLLYSIDIYK